ncbi:MAG TPA: urease accessory protein UreD [Methylomirabilota bacterium]|jgi:urease accessory protein|nr:urease accessory protein UreD [Methylomirabilota bacterium]
MVPQGLAAGAAGLTPAAAPARVGRDGALALGFERRGTRTVLARCRWRIPLQVLAPVALDDVAAIVSVLNPTGGLVGGDRLVIDVDAGPGAHACLTTPSATKVYRTAGAAAEQTVRLSLAPGARLEWVPDHTIPFAGSALRQRIEADVAEDAVLVVVDAFAAGRVARGEAWRFGLYDSALSVRDPRGPLLQDRVVLRDGAPGPGLGLAEDRPYVATVAVIADTGVAAFADDVAALTAPDADVGAGLLPRRGALVRCLAADAPALARVLDGVWAAARRRVLGLAPLALRKP